MDGSASSGVVPGPTPGPTPEGAPDPSDALTVLGAALDGADELDPDARLALLTRVESAVAQALAGLDGL